MRAGRIRTCFPGFNSKEPKGGRDASGAKPRVWRGKVFSKTKCAQARVPVPVRAKIKEQALRTPSGRGQCAGWPSFLRPSRRTRETSEVLRVFVLVNF